MNALRSSPISAALSAALLGCATATPSPATEGSQASISSGPGSWSGIISAVTESSSQVRQPGRGTGYGSVTMSAAASRGQTQLSLTYTDSGVSNRYLNWAVLPGRCGSGSFPLIPISNFPELQVAGNGRAETTVSLPFELPTQGDYHVNIYQERRSTLDAVIACATLKRGAQ